MKNIKVEGNQTLLVAKKTNMQMAMLITTHRKRTLKQTKLTPHKKLEGTFTKIFR